jgi:hypothetical protein
MRSVRAVVAATIMLLAASGFAQSPSPALTWQPLITSSSVVANDELFPAQVLAVATLRPIAGAARGASAPTPEPQGKAAVILSEIAKALGRSSEPPRQVAPGRFGDPNGVLGVTVTSARPGAEVRVSIKVDRFSEESALTVVIPEANTPVEIWPTMRYDTRALAATRATIPTTAVFTMSMDGAQIGEQTRTLRVRSVNDVPFAYARRDGGAIDTSPLFAAFVDENSSVIDPLLRRALDVNVVQQFKGYQGTQQDVIREVFAIWNVLQREGVKYSSITTPSSQSSAVFSQHVRFPDESVKFAQANCADGTVLFASALYKLGINPALIKVPGHMFLGFFTDAQRQHLAFVETTMIGTPGLNSFQKSWRFLGADSYLSSESYRQFLAAMQRGNAEFEQARPSFQARNPNYAVIDIDLARRAGLSPIPRS